MATVPEWFGMSKRKKREIVMADDKEEPTGVISAVSSTTYVDEESSEPVPAQPAVPSGARRIAESATSPVSPPQQPTPTVVTATVVHTPPPPPADGAGGSGGNGGEEPPSPPPPPREPPQPPPFRGYGHQRIFGKLFGPFGRFFGKGMRWCVGLVNPAKSDNHHIMILWLGEWDMFLYSLAVFLVVGSMGLFPQSIKEHITLLWFVFVPWIKLYIEVSEPVAQMKLYEGLNKDRTNQQRDSLPLPVYSVFFTLFLWPLSFFAHEAGAIGFHLSYGWCECLILITTFLMTRFETPLINLLLDEFYEAKAGQKRTETEIMRH